MFASCYFFFFCILHFLLYSLYYLGLAWTFVFIFFICECRCTSKSPQCNLIVSNLLHKIRQHFFKTSKLLVMVQQQCCCTDSSHSNRFQHLPTDTPTHLLLGCPQYTHTHTHTITIQPSQHHLTAWIHNKQTETHTAYSVHFASAHLHTHTHTHIRTYLD